MMTFLRVSIATLVGAVFVLSGFLKLIDPVGTGLKITEYLNVFGMSWLSGGSVFMGTVLSVVEFTLGIALLLRVRIRNLSYLLLAFMAVFTPLTAYLAFFNPIEDCGCFGEAVHLSNTGTFIKNIVLLLLSLFIFWQRRKYRILSSRAFEWGLIGLIAALGIFTGGYCRYALPPVDFTVFRPGAYMEDVVSDLNQSERTYMTTFIYEKEGRKSEFSMDNLPDSTWTYVESRTEEVSEVSEYDMMPLPVMDQDGAYLTSVLAQDDLNLLLTVIYSPDISDARLKRIAQVIEASSRTGSVVPLVLCSADDAFIDRCERILNTEVYKSDYKSLITLNRSNGGMVLVGSGEIITKWSVHQLPEGDRLEKLFATDAKVLAVTEEINSHLFWEILIFSGIILILIVNFILSRYNVKHNIVATRSDDEDKEDIDKSKDNENI